MSVTHDETFTEKLFQACPRNMYVRDFKVESEDKTERSYTFYSRKGVRIGSFRARRLPGCCGVLAVYYLRPSTNDPKQAKATFQRLLSVITNAAQAALYGAILLTQTAGSTGQMALSELAGAAGVNTSTFRNWRTNNTVITYVIHTADPRKPEKEYAHFATE